MEAAVVRFLQVAQLAGVGRKKDVVIHHNAWCYVCIPGTGFDNVVQNVSEVGFLCHFI